MAEAILCYVAESLLKNLGSRALDEFATAWGFNDHLQKLVNTISTIQDVLLDAEDRQFESHAVRGWLHRLKTVVYAADDLFDEFATMALQREGNRLSNEVLNFFSDSNPIAFVFNISNKVKKIREELDEIVKDSSEFTFVLRPLEEGRVSMQLREQSHSFVNVEEVIGREDDREAILDILMASCDPQEHEQRLTVIPIVGMGGLGKTTLTQLLYNDERIEKHFELKLWVCVSEVFDVKEVIKKILMSATNTQCQNVEMDQLQGHLRKEIGGKKYLLVLDDLCNENRDKWLNLSGILKVGGEGSKIIVTTRSRKVVDIMSMDTVGSYDLEGLSEERSWLLFEKMAFLPGESLKKPQLVKLGKEIVKKCAGVPLALRTLGTLLYGNDEGKWISIEGTSFAELPDNQNNIMAILKLSYHHLLSPLKDCFAYCALFPKDYEFDKETLIDLWMAEGFIIPATETQSLKDLGDEYFLSLLQRCFFQDITRDKWGNISSFKMHDLMHDLAIEVAGTESKMAKLKDGDFSDKIRHLSFDYHLTNLWEIPSCIHKAKHLRTFLLPEQFRDGSDFNRRVLKQLISNFRCLRVLDLRNLGISKVPKSIGKLIHLRYLNLSMNPMEELPQSITKLINLQTLLLYGCKRLRALPIHTRKLINLRSLDVLGCYSLTCMPPGLGELTFLYKLPYIIVKHSSSRERMCNPAPTQLKDLKTLKNLRGTLTIRLSIDFQASTSEAKEADLNSKYGLTELLVEWGWSRHKFFDSRVGHYVKILEGLQPHPNLKKLEIIGYQGRTLPSWATTYTLSTTLPNLVEIHLNSWVSHQVPSFSQLPFLRSLRLVRLPKVVYMEMSPLGAHSSSPPPLSGEIFFPSLQELELVSMVNLKGWWDERGSSYCNDPNDLSPQSNQGRPESLLFSKLAILKIKSCRILEDIPLCPNVEELALQQVDVRLNVLKNLTSSTPNCNIGSSVTISDYSSKLKTLSIDEVLNLISLPKECLSQIDSLEIRNSKLSNTSLLENVSKYLSSLSCLKFKHCFYLKSIYEGLEHFTSLESLTITVCRQLDLSQNERVEDGMPWKALKSLHSLEFEAVGKLEHLPSGLQLLTNLHSLSLVYNDDMVELPEWICYFPSLEYMRLDYNPKLKCLPENFEKLTALNELMIEGCPGLTKRCQGPDGSDFHKIKHIPLVTINERSYKYG